MKVKRVSPLGDEILLIDSLQTCMELGPAGKSEQR